jgi:hypothetical protein
VGVKRTDWYRPEQVPARRGWYERDHRRVPYQNREDRRISLDLWEPVRDQRSILYPGVWYVQGEPYWYAHPLTGQRVLSDNINDASYQNLPWRGVVGPAP